MSGLTGARWYFSASHHDEVRQQLHGHSYEVWAFWPSSPHRDQAVLQETLKQVAGGFDHRTLPPELGTMEAMAAAFGALMTDVVKIEIVRPVEGFRVVWDAPRAQNTYWHRFDARCPNNGALISYELRVESPATIMVEEIVDHCSRIGSGFHETIASELHDRFGGLQILKAHHHGVDIETVRCG